MTQHPFGDPGAEQHVARSHASHRRLQVVAICSLEDISVRAGSDRGVDRIIVVEHRHDEHSSVGSEFQYPAGRFDTAHPGHLEVHHDDIGMVQFDCGERLDAV